MKKQTISKIIFIILLIILIIAIIYIVKLNTIQKHLTLDMYNKICNDSNYTFEMVEEKTGKNYKLTVAKSGENISIDTVSPDEHTTTLVNDGYAYYIIHSKEEYFSYDSEEIEADILKNGLDGIEEKAYTYGHEKINNTNYYYEEYEGIGSFVMLSNLNIDESNLVTRFYFDKDKIVYIKTIINDGESEEVLKINFTEDVDENVFTIPENYAEI